MPLTPRSSFGWPRGLLQCATLLGMSGLGELLFGPWGKWSVQMSELRARVGSVQMIFAIEEYLVNLADKHQAAYPEVPGERAMIYDLNLSVPVTREKLLERTPYELDRMRIQWSVHQVQWDRGPVTVGPPDSTGQDASAQITRDLMAIVRAHSRPRMIARRLWMLLPVIPVPLAVVVLVKAVMEHSEALVTLAAIALLATTLIVAILGAAAIYQAVKSHRIATIIRPFTWRQSASTRATVVVAISSVLAGALAGALLNGWLAN